MKCKKRAVGLTGNIASGKSTVGKIFEAYGFPVIEADRIGWKLLKRPDIAEKVIAVFGNVEKDGVIDRKKLGAMVFADRTMLQVLNGIVHPQLLGELRRKIIRSKAFVTVVNAALIFEWDIGDWFDKTVLVMSSEEKKVERLEKKGLTREEALQRIRLQIPECEKTARCDFVIENNGTFEELREKTLKVIAQLKDAFDGDL
jgi:dephospho-CoA kinase